jgi:hypothetical protein
MRLVLGIFILFALYFGWLAGEITVHFYDSFQYLNNARALAGFNSYYDYTRPPVFQFMLSPVMLAYRATGSAFWLERAPYFLMLLLNGVAIWTVWRLLRERLEREIALATIGLFLINRTVFHYIPFVMPDLIAMGFVAAFAINCHRFASKGRQRDAILAGCWLGLAVSTKHYLAPLCLAPAVFFLLEWFSRDEGRIRFRPQLKQVGGLAVMGLCCASLFLLLHKIAFLIVPEYRHQSLFSLLRYIVEFGSAVNGLAQVESFSSSAGLTAGFLADSLSIPLIAVIITGFILAIYTNDRLGRLLTIIAAIHLFVMTVLLVNREARYFLQIYPAFYYFVGVAIKRGGLLWSEPSAPSTSRRARFIAAAVALIVIAGVLRGTAAEARSFTDESYRNDLLIRLGRYVKDHTEAQNRVYWVGNWFGISPKSPAAEERSFFNRDFYYTFHANASALAYYANRQSSTISYINPPQEKIDKPGQGDLIVLNLNEPDSENLNPVRVYSFEGFRNFERDAAESPRADEAIFIETRKRTRLSLVKRSEGFEVRGEGAPFLIWDISLKKYGSIFMNAMPLPQLPGLLRSSAPIEANDLDSLTVIPLGTPQNLFYY